MRLYTTMHMNYAGCIPLNAHTITMSFYSCSTSNNLLTFVIFTSFQDTQSTSREWRFSVYGFRVCGFCVATIVLVFVIDSPVARIFLILLRMSSESWLTTLQNAQKTACIQDGKRKVHYLLQNKQEMVEEYNLNTNVVVRRTWRKRNQFGKEVGWSVEIGEPEIIQNETCVIQENSNMPIIVRRITKTSLEWRIRNLPYPRDVYSVTAEKDDTITIRTSNKKYFKKLEVPDLQRIGLKPQQDNITFQHQLNTLVITYKKPTKLLNVEHKILAEALKVKAIPEDAVQCPIS